jgi:hypothetical protein
MTAAIEVSRPQRERRELARLYRVEKEELLNKIAAIVIDRMLVEKKEGQSVCTTTETHR